MGKLINQQRRAQSKAAKKERMQQIFEAAAETFLRQPYTDVTLDGIGRRAKVRDGLPSLYFGSKEELFLSLLSTQLKQWYAAIEQGLQLEHKLGHAELAELLVTSLVAQPLLIRLTSLMHIVLEQPSDVGAAMTFQYNQEAQLLKLGTLLEERAAAGNGAWVLHRLLLLAAGLKVGAGPLTPDNAVFKIELADELSVLATVLLASTEPNSGG